MKSRILIIIILAIALVGCVETPNATEPQTPNVTEPVVVPNVTEPPTPNATDIPLTQQKTFSGQITASDLTTYEGYEENVYIDAVVENGIAIGELRIGEDITEEAEEGFGLIFDENGVTGKIVSMGEASFIANFYVDKPLNSSLQVNETSENGYFNWEYSDDTVQWVLTPETEVFTFNDGPVFLSIENGDSFQETWGYESEKFRLVAALTDDTLTETWTISAGPLVLSQEISDERVFETYSLEDGIFFMTGISGDDTLYERVSLIDDSIEMELVWDDDVFTEFLALNDYGTSHHMTIGSDGATETSTTVGGLVVTTDTEDMHFTVTSGSIVVDGTSAYYGDVVLFDQEGVKTEELIETDTAYFDGTSLTIEEPAYSLSMEFSGGLLLGGTILLNDADGDIKTDGEITVDGNGNVEGSLQVDASGTKGNVTYNKTATLKKDGNGLELKQVGLVEGEDWEKDWEAKVKNGQPSLNQHFIINYDDGNGTSITKEFFGGLSKTTIEARQNIVATARIGDIVIEKKAKIEHIKEEMEQINPKSKFYEKKQKEINMLYKQDVTITGSGLIKRIVIEGESGERPRLTQEGGVFKRFGGYNIDKRFRTTYPNIRHEDTGSISRRFGKNGEYIITGEGKVIYDPSSKKKFGWGGRAKLGWDHLEGYIGGGTTAHGDDYTEGGIGWIWEF